MMEPAVIPAENYGATATTEISIPTAVEEPGPGGVEIDLGDYGNQPKEKEKHEILSEELDSKAIEQGNIDLLGLEAAATDNHPKVTAPEEPLRHPPGSIMSLSTGSEESAVEDEKFVKIKPCEMESGSSKASSQSGKENLELEEQIQHLNELLEGLKENLRSKDEECQNIKLQLEDILLEKSVEARSIATLTSELKFMKQSHAAKEEQIDEVTLVLDDLLEHFKNLFPPPSDSDSLEVKLNSLRGLPAHFQRLEWDGKVSQLELTEVRGQLQELQDEQKDIIGGYQLVTQNFEKLQSEFEEYRLGVAAEVSESNELKEEFERFREELLSKDEDLIVIQSRCDELQESLEKKTEELVLVLAQLQECTILEAIEKVDKSVETEPIPEVSAETLSPPHSLAPNQDQFSLKIKKLKDQCLDNLHLTRVEQQRLKEELTISIAQNADLTHRLLVQEDEIREKDEAVKQLLSEVQEYQSSIEQKTLEINETLTSKNLEIEHLMATFKTYADGKERKESELNSVIDEQKEIIQLLRTEQDGLKVEREQNLVLREELQKLKATFTTMEQMYLGKIGNLMGDLETHVSKLVTSEAQVAHLLIHIKEQDVRIAALIQQSVDVGASLSQVADLSSQLELKGREVDHLRSELSRLSSVVEGTKDTVRKEYENKLKEDEMLRESEILSLQQQMASMQRELNKAHSSWNMANELATKTKGDNERLRTQIRGVVGEKESIELEWHLLTDQLNWKNEMIVQLEANAQGLNQQIQELMQNLKEQENRTANAEKSLESHHQMVISSHSQSEVRVNEVRLQQLEEEVRALNEASIGKDRKVELLQSKISEIESSEMKAYEETFILKNWVKQLEIENGRYQEEVYLLTNSGNDSNDNPKIRKIQDETMRLIYVLDERDKRCVQLTVEITRLLEERDELQLKLSSVLKHNLELTSDLHAQGPSASGDAPVYKYTDKVELQKKLAQLEDTNFRMNIDLKREREARKLVQEELLYSQASRMYREREIKARLTDHSKVPSPSDSVLHSPETGDHSSGLPITPTNLPDKESLQVVHI